MQYLTLETLNELYSGYNPLNDKERFSHICDFVETVNQDDYDSFPFAVLLVAAITEGTNPDTLSRFCELPLSFVSEVADHLTASGLWLDDGSVDYDFLTAKPGRHWDVSFSMNMLVAQGLLAWTGEKKKGRRVYQITEAGRWTHASRAFEESPVMH